MKKIIVAALLAFTFQASAACETDMLEAYKNGLERAKSKRDVAEIEVKLAELTLAVAELERQVLITTETLNELEKNK